MGTIQQFLRIDSLIKITAPGNKIVMPQNMLSLLASMNVASYVVQRGTCGFCTNSITRREFRCLHAQRQTGRGLRAGRPS